MVGVCDLDSLFQPKQSYDFVLAGWDKAAEEKMNSAATRVFT